MTVTETEEMHINTAWQNRLQQEPRANARRKLEWYIKKNEHEGRPINWFWGK